MLVVLNIFTIIGFDRRRNDLLVDCMIAQTE